MTELWPDFEGATLSYISRPPSEAWQRERPRSLVILGSTGSIGRSALAVIEAHRAEFRVVGLSCGGNARALAAQAMQFRPPFLAVADNATAAALRRLLPMGYTPAILTGGDGYAQLASLPEAATVLSAQAGAAGLAGTLAAALAGKVICLANKESLVMAGDTVREICSRTNAAILPVDSEHNAIFQCVAGRGQNIRSLVLTASGGPFFGKNSEYLRHVTREQALNHPNWRMGAKISIDSATMMNKGLEIVEAFHLYGIPASGIRVLVHPQSVVHSLAELNDGTLLALMGAADMRLPLAHCLLWPRCARAGAAGLDLAAIERLTFHAPDAKTFPCLDLARQAIEERNGLCIVMNAANEEAVRLFLEGGCSFADIAQLTDAAMKKHRKNCPGEGAAYCPPLRTEGGPEMHTELAREVREVAGRIEHLDLASRAFVRELAKSNHGAKTC
ncbi:MAG: 1-deoxy-D-xylulose-5-phosphate reductoisomerase [Desulfovibrio sp.]|jgi:1-deoxy-D-xylulose-5-phosphate reductoisomerase|nr:1-deoxy-D-xylulose-5-phosphate reductoisomerase [Desulfovibrio sp.]